MSLPSGRRLCRNLIRDCHVALESTGLPRSYIFAGLYSVHIMVPIVCIYLFLTRTWFRPIMYAGLTMVLVTQMVARTCPIAKLEWAILPGAERITWKGAEILDQFVPCVSKRLKFRYMVVTTLIGYLFLIGLGQALHTVQF